MSLDSGIILDSNSRHTPFYTIMSINKPQVRPFIAIPLDIPATKNRSNQFIRSFLLFFRLAVGQNFISFLRGNDKSFIVPGENATVNIDVPILQRGSHGLNLALYTLFNRR